MNVKDRLIDIIDLIEKRPGFFFEGDYTYNELCSFFNGYLNATDGEIGNIEFSQWLSEKYGQNSLFWIKYIFYLAKENEAEAKRIVLMELKAFVSSFENNVEVYCLYNDDRTEFEAVNKGWRSDIYVKVGPQYYHLNIYDIVRLQQDFETEVEHNGIYASDPNMVLVNEVSRDEIKKMVGHLVSTKFFDHIKPIGSEVIKALHLISL